MAETYKILGQEFAEDFLVDKKFVAIASYNTTASYSTDGITWTQTTMPSSANWTSVTYGDDKFVAVANTTTAAYSTDGITWTQTTMPASSNWSSVTYGDSKFVAVGDTTTAAYSTDGITWTASTMPSVLWESVTHGDGKFVAVASNTNAAYSTDGITWTQTTMPANETWTSVTYGGGKFVAVARSYSTTSVAAYSTNGITWTQTSLQNNARWHSVTYGSGFVAVGFDAFYFSGPYISYSTDGISWTAGVGFAYNNFEGSDITYADNKFVLVGLESFYSTDAITWTQTTMPSSANWTSVTYGDQSGYNPKTIYTVPANTEASISSISVINNGTSSGDYYLGVVKAADSSTPGISNTQTIIPNKTLAAGAIDEIVGGITLSAGDQIRIYSESPDITAHIYGVELS